MPAAAVLFPATAHVGELLPADANALDVLGPGPLVSAPARLISGSSGAVTWLAHSGAEHNAHATRIAGQVRRRPPAGYAVAQQAA